MADLASLSREQLIELIGTLQGQIAELQAKIELTKIVGLSFLEEHRRNLNQDASPHHPSVGTRGFPRPWL